MRSGCFGPLSCLVGGARVRPTLACVLFVGEMSESVCLAPSWLCVCCCLTRAAPPGGGCGSAFSSRTPGKGCLSWVVCWENAARCVLVRPPRSDLCGAVVYTVLAGLVMRWVIKEALFLMRTGPAEALFALVA